MHVCITLKEDGPSVEREPPWVGVGGWRAVGEHFSDADGAAASLVGRSAGQKPWMPHVAQALGSTLLAKWRVLKEVT